MEYKQGDIRKANEVGLKSSYLVIYYPCQNCGKLRWIQYVNGKPLELRYCRSCLSAIPRRKTYTVESLRTGVKKCNRCGETYPLDKQYFYSSTNNITGFQARCKQCASELEKEKRIKSGKQIYESREAVVEYRRKYHPHRTVTPLENKLHMLMRAHLNKVLNGNKNGRRWETLVGYTVKDLKKYLEKQFTEGMNWGNYGRSNKGKRVWQIDHIIPKSAFRITSTDDFDFKRCWALSNLQPLWAEDNRTKWDKVTLPYQLSLHHTSSMSNP